MTSFTQDGDACGQSKLKRIFRLFDATCNHACHLPPSCGFRSTFPQSHLLLDSFEKFLPLAGDVCTLRGDMCIFHLGPLRVTHFLFSSRTSRAHQLIMVTSVSTSPSSTLKQRKPRQDGPAKLGVSQGCDGWPGWGPPSGGGAGQTPDPTGPVLSSLHSEADPKAWDGMTHGSHFWNPLI